MNRVKLKTIDEFYAKYPTNTLTKFKRIANYLMLININSRKAYAYEKSGKGAKEVLRSLNEFSKVELEC